MKLIHQFLNSTHQLFCVVERRLQVWRWLWTGIEKANAIGSVRLCNAYVLADDNTVAVPRNAKAFAA